MDGYPKSFNSWIDKKAILKLTTEKSLNHVLIITTKYNLTFIDTHSSKNPHPHATIS